MPVVLLSSLKKYPLRVIGITSMTDSGGSGGYFRQKFEVLPPSDIRRHILALSNAPVWKKNLWQFRFGQEVFEDGHQGHVFANAFISGLEIAFKNYNKVIEYIHNFMEIGENAALPAAIQPANLFAELENGQIIQGEAEIDVPKLHNPNLKIKRVFLNPPVKIFNKTRKEILDADIIIIGPGDLYSSIIPCFLPEGASAALKKSKAKKIFICPTIGKPGETQDFSIVQLADEIEKYIAMDLDFVLYHHLPLNINLLAEYNRKNSLNCTPLKIDANLDKNKFIAADILKTNEFAYDSRKIIKQIFKIAKI